MAEERDFEVIDKRRIKPEATEAAEPAETDDQPGGQETGGGITAEELRAAMEEAGLAGEAGGAAMPQLDVPGALSVCINMLNEVAWMKMGLVPDPVTGKIEKDLPQAKVAIDAAGDLVARLEPLVGGTERRDLQVMLSNLRINFVQQSQRA